MTWTPIASVGCLLCLGLGIERVQAEPDVQLKCFQEVPRLGVSVVEGELQVVRSLRVVFPADQCSHDHVQYPPAKSACTGARHFSGFAVRSTLSAAPGTLLSARPARRGGPVAGGPL